MNDLNIIDQFTATFVAYIDSGFGLLSPDVGFLTAILIGIDITLAGLFWAFAEDKSVIPGLIKKVLYVGAFAFILNNFSQLADIIFASFAGLGLRATGSPISAADLMRPGFVAATGYDAAEPLLTEISSLLGPVAFFENFVAIAVLMFAWIIVLLAFFVLAIQLFITILEFKLTALAGFVLVPFALWGKTAFLAERVLGNVVAAGIKLMVLAIIIGIGSTLFASFASSFSGGNITLEQAASTVLGALSIFMLGIFGPAIAAGLVSGAPQLGAGAAIGAVAGVAAGGVAGGSVAMGAGRMISTGAQGATHAAASMAGGAGSAFNMARTASGATGIAGVAAGVSGVARAGVGGATQAARNLANRVTPGAGPGSGSGSGDGAPDWARRLQSAQRLREAGMITAHAIRDGDRPMSADAPKLQDDDQ